MNECRVCTPVPDTHQFTQVVTGEGWGENVRKQSYHVTSPPHPSTRPFPFKADPQTGQKEIQWIFLFPQVCVCARAVSCVVRMRVLYLMPTLDVRSSFVCMVEIFEPDFVLGKGIL